MRALIFWARDQRGTLRILQRSATEISGVILVDGDTRPFRFDPISRQLTYNERLIFLDEYGLEIFDPNEV